MECLAEQRGSHRLPQRRQLVRPVHRPLTGFGVPLPQERDHHLLDQTQFAVGGVAIEAQVAWLYPEGPEGRGEVGDGEGILVVGLDAGHRHAFQEAEPLEPGHLLERQAARGAQLFGRQTGTRDDARGRGRRARTPAAPVPPACAWPLRVAASTGGGAAGVVALDRAGAARSRWRGPAPPADAGAWARAHRHDHPPAQRLHRAVRPRSTRRLGCGGLAIGRDVGRGASAIPRPPRRPATPAGAVPPRGAWRRDATCRRVCGPSPPRRPWSAARGRGRGAAGRRRRRPHGPACRWAVRLPARRPGPRRPAGPGSPSKGENAPAAGAGPSASVPRRGRRTCGTPRVIARGSRAPGSRGT